MPNKFERHQKRFREVQARHEKHRKEEMAKKNLKCTVCTIQGHAAVDCRKKCSREWCTVAAVHHYQECPTVEQYRKEKQERREKEYNENVERCDVCDRSNHSTDECKFKCNRKPCQDDTAVPHHYQYCPKHRCRRCFSQHSREDDCDYEKGAGYIISQYRKNMVCECVGVRFWYDVLNPRCIDNYDGSCGAFFEAYPKPKELKKCTNPVQCTFKVGDKKLCNGHHHTNEHHFFH